MSPSYVGIDQVNAQPNDNLDPSGLKPEGARGGGKTNAPPTDMTLSNASVDENSAGGTSIGSLSTEDSDKRERFTYTLTDDADGRFVIAGDEIRVADGADLDYETQSSHFVIVQVTDKGGNIYPGLPIWMRSLPSPKLG